MDEPAGVDSPVFAVKVVAASDDIEALLVATFEREQARLNAFAYAATHDTSAAEDAVAEAFARLVAEVRAGRTPDTIEAWLFRVCGNLILSRGRRTSVARRALGRLVDRGAARSPEDAAIERETDSELLAALGRLGRDARVALLLAAQGLSAAEVGGAIGRTPEATRTLLCRSRLKLRDELAHGEGFDR
jgi:RNA polymerase sigma-70 factor (ECF subfamily)